MKPWEFFIQKEGDRDWLSVQKPVVEIEEGKYCLVARSHRADLDVEISLIYQKDFQKFYRRSNSEGLITILAGIELQPGLWELRCYGDLMSELLGACRQENLQLKVFSKSTTSTQKNQFPSTNPKAEPYLQQLEQLLQQEIEPMLGAVETPDLWLEPGDCLAIEADEESHLSASLPMFSEPLYPLDWEELFDEPITDEPTTQKQSLTFAKLAAQELKVILEKETFARKKGEAIAISGRIETLKPTSPNPLESVILNKLLYELRNPQTGETCIALVQSIGETSLPYLFESYLEIPSEWEVSLIIGSVILEMAAGLTVIRQPFIVTTDLKEEVSNPRTPRTINSNELSRTINYLLAQEAKSPPLNLDLPEPNKMNKKLQYSRACCEPSILPPQLTQAPNQSRSLQLPSLPKSQATASATEISKPLPKKAEILKDSPTEVKQSHASVEEAFDALPLNERFLFRLNSLAKSEKSAIDKQ